MGKTRHIFYEVAQDAYLFGKALPSASERQNPEEAVRQWCAYELLGRYGVNINDLEFERPVRVGSKDYRIDILVLRDGIPSTVVECKPCTFSNHKAAISQAVSYANSENVRAEFTLYTNGQVWHVMRRVQQEWVPITDLPRQFDQIGARPITELLTTVHDVSALLCKLGGPLDGEDARMFLSALQRFFNGTNILTQDTNLELRFATDNLLRSLWAYHDEVYQTGKFEVAYRGFEQYRRLANIGREMPPESGGILVGIRQLYAGLMSIVEGVKGCGLADLLLLRLATSLVSYGQQVYKVKSAKNYPRLPDSLHEALRNYLDYGFVVHLDFCLPDPLDNIWNSDIRNYCPLAWDTFVEAEKGR